MHSIGKARLIWDWVSEYLEAFWYIVERLFFDYHLTAVGEQKQAGRGSILHVHVVYFHIVRHALIQEHLLGSEQALEA